MTTKRTFLEYKIDGKAQEEHRLPVETLLDSLNGFKDSIYEAHKVLHGNDAELPEINVVAFKPGSFETILEVANHVVSELDTLQVLGFAVLPAVADGVVKSVVQALRHIKGRAFDIINNRDGTFTISVDGQEPIVTNKAIAVSLKNPKIRNGIESLFADPVSDEGTDTVSLSLYDPINQQAVEAVESVIVTPDETETFQSNPTSMEDEIKTDVESLMVSFIKINFAGPTGWKMVLPNRKKVGTRVEDQEFLAKVKGDNDTNSMSFRSDDLFDVVVKKTTTHNKHSKKKSESYVVVKVTKQITDKGKGNRK